MNVSMQDGFNLGWKLASVLRGRCSPKILHSYSDERHAVAKELIDFDRKWARMFSARPKDPSKSDGEGVDPASSKNTMRGISATPRERKRGTRRRSSPQSRSTNVSPK